MVAILDDNIKAVQDALVAKGMWDSTLMVFSSGECSRIRMPRAALVASYEGGGVTRLVLGHAFVHIHVRGTWRNER